MPQVVVVSDLHVGSIYGLLPETFTTSGGTPSRPNTGQQYLLQCWKDFLSRVARLSDVAAVVVNGDIVDGSQRAQSGTEFSLPILQDQVEAAIRLLRPLLQAAKDAPLYLVAGTEYHDGRAAAFVEQIGRSLGAERYAGPGTGRYSREVLDLELDGVVVNFSHGISVATGFYRATPADREGIWSALAGKEKMLPRADVVVRSHAHTFIHVEHASKHILITPCWQLQTRYMRKNSVYRMVPDIGGLVLHLDPAAKKAGEDPCQIQKMLYALPPYRPVKVNHSPRKTSGKPSAR